MSKVLVAGWFSYEGCGATAGDLLACDLLGEWLTSAGYAYDVAVVPPFTGGVNVRQANPAAYSHAIFVCGPFERKALEAHFLGRFARCCVIGLNRSQFRGTPAPFAGDPDHLHAARNFACP